MSENWYKMSKSWRQHRLYPQISFYNLCGASRLDHLSLKIFILHRQTQLLLKFLQWWSKSNNYSLHWALNDRSKFWTVELINSCIRAYQQYTTVTQHIQWFIMNIMFCFKFNILLCKNWCRNIVQLVLHIALNKQSF